MLAGAVMFAAPASAQPGGMVSAADPEGIMRVLKQAGYAAELGSDSYGDPEIELEIADYATTILFYGCDANTHANCDSIQLRSGFDRGSPLAAADALAISKQYRFASVWLDDAGDPWVQWDIMTGTGIPAQVLLAGLESFGDTLQDTAEIVFSED